MWRIRIHATYKIGMERICHTCVTNAFKICDEFVRIIHACEKYEVWILWFNKAVIGNNATNKLCKSNILYTHWMARKYAHKNVGPWAALMFYKGPSVIDDLLRTSLK